MPPAITRIINIISEQTLQLNSRKQSDLVIWLVTQGVGIVAKGPVLIKRKKPL